MKITLRYFQHRLKTILSSLFNTVNTYLSWKTARNLESGMINKLHI